MSTERSLGWGVLGRSGDAHFVNTIGLKIDWEFSNPPCELLDAMILWLTSLVALQLEPRKDCMSGKVRKGFNQSR